MDGDASFVDKALQPESGKTFDNGAGEGDKKKKAQEVGAEARGKKHYPSCQHHGTVQQMLGREASLGHFKLDAAQDIKSLSSGQIGPGDAGDENEGDRGANADQSANLQKNVEFNNGNNNEDNQQSYKHFYLKKKYFLNKPGFFN
jgi:hypothetical protein